MNRKSRLISSLLTGFTVAFYFALVLPVQTYLANADSFNYTLGALLGDLCLPLVLTFAGVSLALFFLSRWIGQFLHILLLALVVAAFAESGPLSIGLPELNGDFSGYKSMTRAIWDWSILLGIVLIPLCCYRWLRDSATWIALALTVYLGATLFDVKVKSQRPEGMEDFIVPRLVPRTDVVRSAEFSPKRNVIMLILDSISVDACVDAFAADPDLASHFTGFVNYTNNVGMMWPTHMAIPGIFTGKYCESIDELSKHGQSMWMKDSFIKPYLDRNIPIYVNVALSREGYTNRLKPTGDDAVLKKCSPTKDRMLGLYPMTIPELMQFRALPYFAKETYVSGLSFPTNSSPGQALNATRLFDDAYLWQELAKKPVNPDLEMTMHVHHVNGSHLPIRHRRDGQAAKKGDVSYVGYVDECLYAFRQVAKLLDVWKTNGVYDASTIIIAADHAIMQKPDRARKDVPNFLFPFLMAKPSRALGPINYSAATTSHSKLHGIMLNLADKDISGKLLEAELVSILRRGINITDKKQEWCFDVWGKAKNREYTLEKIELKPIELNKVESFRVNNTEMFYNYYVKGGRKGMTDGTAGSDMTFRFKVPSAELTYDFRFWILPLPLRSKGVLNVCSGEVSVLSSYNQTLSFVHTILLENVKSSPDGMVDVRIKRESGQDDCYCFGLHAMKVCKHKDDQPLIEGQELYVGDIELTANAKGLERKVLCDKLQAGKSYGIQIASGIVTRGGRQKIYARILDLNNQVVDFTCFDIKDNALNNSSWCFTTPRKADKYQCIIYVGEYGSTDSAGIKLKGVRIVDMGK